MQWRKDYFVSKTLYNTQSPFWCAYSVVYATRNITNDYIFLCERKFLFIADLWHRSV